MRLRGRFSTRRHSDRGIMPLAVIVFNSNNFAVEVEGASCELNLTDGRVRPMAPDQAAQRCTSRR